MSNDGSVDSSQGPSLKHQIKSNPLDMSEGAARAKSKLTHNKDNKSAFVKPNLNLDFSKQLNFKSGKKQVSVEYV